MMGGLRNLDDDTARTLAFGGTATVAGFELGPEDVLVQMDAADSGFLVAARDNLVVSIDPTITYELQLEGLAREVINRVQRMRKEADLAVEDRIQIHYETSSELLSEALDAHGYLLGEETLSTRVNDADGSWFGDDHQIEGESIRIAFSKM